MFADLESYYQGWLAWSLRRELRCHCPPHIRDGDGAATGANGAASNGSSSEASVNQRHWYFAGWQDARATEYADAGVESFP